MAFYPNLRKNLDSTQYTDYPLFYRHKDKIYELKYNFSNSIGDLYPSAEWRRLGL